MNVIVIITGASRGFGQAVACTYVRNHYDCREQKQAVLFVFIGRSEKGLNETKNKTMQEQWENLKNDRRTITPTTTQITETEIPNDNSNNITIRTVVADLSDLNTLDNTIDEIVSIISLHRKNEWKNSTLPTKLIFINNAGSLGYVGPTIDSPSLHDMQHSINFNITSSLWLSVRIMRYVMESQQEPCSVIQYADIVNVSSLTAVEPFPTMSIYSAGKAARDMYHKCISKEMVCQPRRRQPPDTTLSNDAKTLTTTLGGGDEIEQQQGEPKSATNPQQQQPSKGEEETSATHNGNIRILNYAPGPLETDMTNELRVNDQLDSTLRQFYQNPKFIDPYDSASKLLRLLHNDAPSFASGDHVDYYDLLE